jgi:hypothetical protein
MEDKDLSKVARTHREAGFHPGRKIEAPRQGRDDGL